MSEDRELYDKTIGFIGAGNMAEAIARGILASDLASSERLLASDPDPERRNVFERLGCTTDSDNCRIAAESDILILAVKPQVIDDIVRGMVESIRPGVLVITIAAGVPCGRLEGVLPESARVVRIMPNTPMLVGRGMAGVAGGSAATKDDLSCALKIFGSAGFAFEVEEEMLHAVTAVSGSGPAYLFYFVESLAAAARDAGIPDKLAMALAKGTVLGSAQLLLDTGEDPAQLRRKVTSPGGTTAAALESFKQNGFPETVRLAVQAALKRSHELGRTEKE
jgi:pyrroline-5-carboxylate reductase